MNDEAPHAESADTLPPLDEAATRFVEELALFWEGTRPTSEEVAERIGFNPLDLRPLVLEMTGDPSSLGAAL